MTLSPQAQSLEVARRGRPSKPADERLSEIVSIRVSPKDIQNVYRYAKRHGVPMDAVLRAVLRRLVAA